MSRHSAMSFYLTIQFLLSVNSLFGGKKTGLFNVPELVSSQGFQQIKGIVDKYRLVPGVSDNGSHKIKGFFFSF